MIFCDVGGPWAHFGGPGPHLEDFWYFCDFGGRSGREKVVPFGHNFGPNFTKEHPKPQKVGSQKASSKKIDFRLHRGSAKSSSDW